jgi:hypothetical protein
MQISNNYNSPNFGAKFFHSESLKMIAEHATKTGKFEKLNQARKNIDNAYLTTRLRVDVARTEGGYPVLMISKYKPKNGITVPKTIDDYKLIKVSEYESFSKGNPLVFALRKLIKLGNNAPNNNLYKEVVISDK